MKTQVQDIHQPRLGPAVPPAPMAAEVRPEDEFANFLTHGYGFLLSVLGSIVLMEFALKHSPPRVLAGCGVYCFSLIGLYGASTLSHSFYDLRWRRWFRTLDQAFIYVLIAGSFTPYATVFLMEGRWPLLLAAMWFFALLGVALVLWMRNLSTLARFTYGILGWLPVLSVPELVRVAPMNILFWVLLGGVFYSIGTIFLANDRKVRYLHALWHAFVIAGSTSHYIAILLLVIS
ncbi:PAQR family membrane homeostasis protein TrhA [Planctomicrobium sp. SH664]|uniref:PAQR family membrane homeostasis protein TrhA n=1 Tax=Planctomicrobium sp. SH664 TaxID=3448125 RepID=UPI003F5C250A